LSLTPGRKGKGDKREGKTKKGGKRGNLFLSASFRSLRKPCKTC